ncbi:unnamed protein product [Cuscuta campestris]|uniref:Uncharacterized protein n=1 Tax=Cuscuta campestris TaxID=132261 RepID=A0A484L4K5_9ASTE|nr:unnamed protein product [Cuscuta campestris]
MAEVKKEAAVVSLKLLIDDSKNRVVAAEAKKDLVDILFGFLALPMATVIRLTATSGATIGYNCKNLGINIDDSGSEITYACSAGRYCSSYYSQYPNLSCVLCRQGTTTIERRSGGYYEGGFLQGGVVFIISDDLRIRPASPAVLSQLLPADLITLSEAKQFREMSVDVSKDEVLGLLAHSMFSESSLSDFFLGNKGGALSHQKKVGSKLSPSIATAVQTTPEQNPPSTTTLNLKVTTKKSTNKILFAEATDEFFDFLCSFLTTPLGSMAHVLDGHSGFICIDNLYLSVLELEDKWFLSGLKSTLQNPKIAPYHNCKKQPLKLEERVANAYLLKPRGINNFALQPSVFMVPDDLEVKPLSLLTSFNLMREVVEFWKN